MIVSYCEKWFQPEGRPIKPMLATEARARHERRQPYCALIGGEENPTHVISVAGAWVSVSFLDERKREYLRYDFNEPSHGRLFLTTALCRAFDGETDDVVGAMQFAFKPDGFVLIEQRDLRTKQVNERRWNGATAANWESYPAFGDYSVLCRRERGLPFEREGVRSESD